MITEENPTLSVQSALSITAYPRREELLVIGDWSTPAAVGEPIKLAAEELKGLLEIALLSQSITEQEAADELTKTLSEIGRWTQDLADLGEAFRRPYLEKHRQIKAAVDAVLTPLMILSRKAGELIGNFEAEKIRTKEALEEQARKEAAKRTKEESERNAKAELDRQAAEKAEAKRIEELEKQAATAKSKKKREELEQQIETEKAKASENAEQRLTEQQQEQERLRQVSTPDPVHYNPARTAGTNVAVGFEFDVIDEKAFAQWIWQTGKDEWIREIAFDKRSVMAWINAQKPPTPTAIPTVPGLNIRRCVGVAVKKASKAKAALTAATQKVDLNPPEPVLSQWIDTPHSSQILRVGYDPEQEIMQIVFKNGGNIYDYYRVPAAVFEGFRTADSAGIYFGKTVKGVFSYRKRL